MRRLPAWRGSCSWYLPTLVAKAVAGLDFVNLCIAKPEEQALGLTNDNIEFSEMGSLHCMLKGCSSATDIAWAVSFLAGLFAWDGAWDIALAHVSICFTCFVFRVQITS